ncbi:MAG: amidohydrolase [Bacteroidota bacterium]|nr:amidohydrolase [Bacteroidota bacterium]
MKITLVQADIAWENKEVNFSKYESLLNSLTGKIDVVVLPEMFSTGFSMNCDLLAENMNGQTMKWISKITSSAGFAMIGSFIAVENSKYYNRLVFMKPDGNYATYDKGHLFRMEKENKYYSKGERPVIYPFRDWRFSLQICYDLRFPVWSRNVNNAYDVLVYIANWPEARRNVWNTLLPARAIENQCFVLGVNRIGKDGNGIDHCGDSMIVDPKGKIIAQTNMYAEEIISHEISLDDLNLFRDKFPVWNDADRFKLLSD